MRLLEKKKKEERIIFKGLLLTRIIDKIVKMEK